eukprot:scaffold9862_cov118-Isochrysis_galbana.AAC.7
MEMEMERGWRERSSLPWHDALSEGAWLRVYLYLGAIFIFAATAAADPLRTPPGAIPSLYIAL